MALCFVRRLFALIAGVCMGGAMIASAPGPVQAQTAECQITVETSAALTEVLLRPADQKAGLVICLASGTYAPLDWERLKGAFQGIPDAQPMTITSADRSRAAVLGPWEMSSKRGSAPNGNLTLSHVTIRLESAEMAPGQKGFSRHMYGVLLGRGGVTRNFTLRGVRIEGPMREARRGGQRTEALTHGVSGWGENVTITGNLFTQIVNAVSVWGEDIVISYNRGHRLWGDLVRLSAIKLRGQDCRPSRNIVVRNNIFSDSWSDNTEHPDVIHMFPHSGVPCGLNGVLIEGNIAYVGREGMIQPGRPTGFRIAAPYPVPPVLARDFENMHTLIGPGTVTLPSANCGTEQLKLGIQKAAGMGQGPVVLQAAPGDRLMLYGRALTSYDIRAEGEAWLLICRGKNEPIWHMRAMKSGPQGFFSNKIRGADGYKNMIIRNNVFWLTSGHGVRLSDEDNDRILVANNSFLQPFHGDANGDGRPNTEADGFNGHTRGTNIIIDGNRIEVRDNISSQLGNQRQRPGWRNNDDQLRHDDGGRSMRARFNWPAGAATLYPATPYEAIEMARPRRDGALAGSQVGAVAPSAAQDWYDWSWVPKR